MSIIMNTTINKEVFDKKEETIEDKLKAAEEKLLRAMAEAENPWHERTEIYQQ